MFKRSCLTAAVLALAFSSAPSWADDTSDIRTSGKAFAEALRDGDVLNAKKYAFTDDTSDKALNVMTELTHARKKLIDAAVAKFGDEGKNVVVGGASMARTQEVSTDFDGAKIDVHGDTATVASKDGADKRPAYFKKVSGIWKIDLTKLADFTSVTRNAAVMHAVAGSFLASADEISGGKYKTVAEAKTAVQKNMVAAIGGGRRGG
ncbi:MAG TPA: hypothetical protein VIM11_27170 [Tepidisphaeraceae bacterium]|jgi:hypothetical protein